MTAAIDAGAVHRTAGARACPWMGRDRCVVATRAIRDGRPTSSYLSISGQKPYRKQPQLSAAVAIISQTPRRGSVEVVARRRERARHATLPHGVALARVIERPGSNCERRGCVDDERSPPELSAPQSPSRRICRERPCGELTGGEVTRASQVRRWSCRVDASTCRWRREFVRPWMARPFGFRACYCRGELPAQIAERPCRHGDPESPGWCLPRISVLGPRVGRCVGNTERESDEAERERLASHLAPRVARYSYAMAQRRCLAAHAGATTLSRLGFAARGLPSVDSHRQLHGDHSAVT